MKRIFCNHNWEEYKILYYQPKDREFPSALTITFQCDNCEKTHDKFYHERKIT